MSIGFRAFLEIVKPDPRLIEEYRQLPSSNIGDCVKRMNCMFGGIRGILMILNEVPCRFSRWQQRRPVHTPIPKIIQMFKEGKLTEAGQHLFENNPMSAVFAWKGKIGGLLQCDIPVFRLPKSFLDRYQNRMEQMDITIRTNITIGSVLMVDELFCDG